MELIKMKADPTIDTGNSILHSLVQIPNQEEKFEKEAGKFLDAVLKITGPGFLDRRTHCRSSSVRAPPHTRPSVVNTSGESPLFRAIQFGNLAWTRLILEREANPFLAFVPATRPTCHAERYRKVYIVRLALGISPLISYSGT